MKYYKVSKVDGTKTKISKKEAKRLLEGNYRDIDSMLKVEQIIPLMYSNIEVMKGR